MAFSIKQLLFGMAVVAFALMAFMNADKPFVGELFDLLTLGLLIAIAYGAWTTQGEPRAFRIGFLCWGALYYWMFKQTFDIGTGKLINVASRMIRPVNSQYPEPMDDLFNGAEQQAPLADWDTDFHSIGHSLFLLLFGLIGGWVTVYFYRKRQRMYESRE